MVTITSFSKSMGSCNRSVERSELWASLVHRHDMENRFYIGSRQVYCCDIMMVKCIVCGMHWSTLILIESVSVGANYIN